MYPRNSGRAVGQEGGYVYQIPSHCMSYFFFSISDPFIFNLCSKDRSSDHYSCQCHSYGDLRELRQARFLLQVCPGERVWEGPSLYGTGGSDIINISSECEDTPLLPTSCLCTVQCPLRHTCEFHELVLGLLPRLSSLFLTLCPDPAI